MSKRRRTHDHGKNIPHQKEQSLRTVPPTNNSSKEREKVCISDEDIVCEKQSDSQEVRLARELNRITKFSAVINFCALIGLCVSVCFAGLATRAATHQVTISEKEFQASQRPWLAINVQASRLSVHKLGSSIYSAYVFKNVGHSVALNVLYRPKLIFNDLETGRECDFTDEREKNFYAHQPGVVVFPEQTVTNNFAPVGTEPDQLQKFAALQRAKGPALRLIACVTYVSAIDGKTHHTSVPYWILDKDGITAPSTMNNDQEYVISLSADINGEKAD